MPSASVAVPGGRQAWAAPVALLLLVAAAFAPALGADWVQWDDDRNFTENWAWRGLTPDHLAWMATTFHMGHYQPLSWLTLGLDWELWGLDARGYHLTNVALHAATALALFQLARRLLAIGLAADLHEPSVELGALCAAASFAVHPLRVESVAWITERRDVLGGMFFVLAIQAWIRYATATAGRRARWYAAALVFALLSLCAKAAAIVLPALLLVLDVWPLRRLERQARLALLDKLPFVLLSGVFGALALAAQASTQAALIDIERHGLAERAVQAAYGLAFYTAKTLWPVNLVPIHELPASLLTPRLLIPAAAAVALTLILVGLRGRAPALLAAWTAFAVILSPVSGVAQAGPQLVADRYSYFSTMPFAILAGAALAVLARRNAGVARTVLLVLAGALCWATHVQTRVWRDTRALWEHTLAVDPDCGVALHNLGSWCLVQSATAPDAPARRALLQEARALFERGARAAPAPKFEVGLGVVAGELAALEPERADALRREALARIEGGVRWGEALGRVETAWRFQLGAALLESGRSDDAARELEQVVRDWPDNPQGQRVLALARAAQGRFEDAAHHVEVALRSQPQEPVLWLRLGTFRSYAGQRDSARAALERALELCGLDPAFAELARAARAELLRMEGGD
ncbi:MAG: tetratricopeptide repeat protein [Planctomycetes bacterium]|nr:tetratricopeptide repeat protein [Planctomycetota bacterium]